MYQKNEEEKSDFYGFSSPVHCKIAFVVVSFSFVSSLEGRSGGWAEINYRGAHTH